MVSLKPHLTRTYFRVRLRMFDIKCNFKKKYSFNLSCPFCKNHDEDFKHIVTCEEGMKFPARLNIRNLLEASQKLHPEQVNKKLEQIRNWPHSFIDTRKYEKRSYKYPLFCVQHKSVELFGGLGSFFFIYSVARFIQ